MKVSLRLLPALLLASFAATAISVPLPEKLAADGATLNVNVQLAPWMQIQEDLQAPNLGEQVFLRRVRLITSGNFNKNFLFFLDLDSPNFGKAGDFTTRELVQDAWVSWNPTDGVFLDAGLLLIPLTRHLLQSTTSYTNNDFHVDSINPRMPNTDGLRDMGISLRGWLFDKRVGYRVGAYNGNRGTTPGADPSQKFVDKQGAPRVAGFLNFNIVGSEEGAWLYQGLYFDKTVVSVGIGAEYQPGGAIAPVGVTDYKALAADVFVDLALAGDQEFIFSATGYRINAGDGAANTGYAGFVDLGYRIGMVQPYVSAEGFFGDSCTTDPVTGANITGCKSNTNENREVSVGVNFWIKRNLFHVNTEYALIRNGNLTPAAGVPQVHTQRFTLGCTMLY